ncbi:MAG TPA: hypothetical protein DDX19_06115 [Rhodopirellula baltica]|uniref:SLA1 homology domain-containing protein n=1 Tax=Rhodopirellula baltica (strain DSM 10527 / NCIMB 13988 / SH1) TaxID=243090 RepID=Q7UIG9_RHOBA|nr:SHD1 domain-containing protein [Rhodopirellula baltica]CAD77645.1 hypothetical protein-signal peptide and transmembrane prediction [Rhodopirellula baltica SH 1]HBE62310.1 hypothetical protein [Rhodopirellula baltica]
MFHLEICRRMRWLLLLLLMFPTTALAIDPVRPGDQIEVKHLGSWRPGEVLEYQKGQARVRYTFIQEHEGIFKLADMRFPNNEGNWMIWKDASGKFLIPARLLERTPTKVKLLKEDGATVEVSIDKLAANLQQQLSKIAKAEKEFVDAALVRVGDQVELKKYSTWYPATVKALLPDGAKVEYEYGSAKDKREADAKYEDMRYPNNEGPWADWTDISGKHKVKARYLTHDATHVDLLLQGDKRIRLERSKLAAEIEEQLALRAIVARRPDEVDFDVSGVDFDNLPPWISYGTDAPAPDIGVAGGPASDSRPSLSNGYFRVPLETSGKIDAAILVDGSDGWIAFGITPETIDASHPVSMQWVNLMSQARLPGPNFFEGEVIIGYSAEQRRLLTAEGLDVRGSASRFCTYRLEPGSDTATPEWKWSVPKVRFYSYRDQMNASFVGEDRILVGYGGTLTMWNMATKTAEYVIPSKKSEMNFSPDQRHFITNQYSHAVIIETESGKPVADVKKLSTVSFAQDGNHLVGSGNFSESLLDLQTGKSRSITSGFRANKTSEETDPSVIDQRWLSTGNRLFDLDRGWLIWTEGYQDLEPVMRHVIGDKILSVGQSAGVDGIELVIGVNDAVNPTAVQRISTITEEELYVLRPGVRVRIDSAVSDPRIRSGVERAIAVAGYQQDPSAEIVIEASAYRGKRETQTYSESRFAGFGRSRGSSETQTISAAPWIQAITVKLGQQRLWSTGQGGIPGFLSVREGESLQAEVQKCEREDYSLFQNFELPDKVMAAKWTNGFGTTSLTPNGFIDEPVL